MCGNIPCVDAFLDSGSMPSFVGGNSNKKEEIQLLKDFTGIAVCAAFMLPVEAAVLKLTRNDKVGVDDSFSDLNSYWIFN